MTRAAAYAVLGLGVVAGCTPANRPTRFRHVELRSNVVSCRSDVTAQARTARIRWVGPDDLREKARLDSWCAGVGPALLRDELGAAEAPLHEVMFVSWNVHVGNADIARFVGDLQSGKLSEGRRPRHLVLMLQEAIRSGDVPALLPDTASTAGRIGPADADAVGISRLSQQLNMSVFYVPSMRDGAASETYSPADRGNAILSTVRLSDPSAIELPGDGQRRVAVTATVPVTAGSASAPLSIVAAHLSTRGPA